MKTKVHVAGRPTLSRKLVDVALLELLLIRGNLPLPRREQSLQTRTATWELVGVFPKSTPSWATTKVGKGSSSGNVLEAFETLLACF